MSSQTDKGVCTGVGSSGLLGRYGSVVKEGSCEAYDVQQRVTDHTQREREDMMI